MEMELLWQPYRFFPYEKSLATREVEALLEPIRVQETPLGLQVKTSKGVERAMQLTYFRSLVANGVEHRTKQSLLEATAVGESGNRQGTRYSVHGFHEYKGKFNPQVARAVLHTFQLPKNARVLDPFCGSGTTLIECSHLGIRSVGTDINPLAAFIAQAKGDALRIAADNLLDAHERATKAAKKSRAQTVSSDVRTQYLSEWFTPEVLSQIERLRVAIELEPDARVARILKVFVSDLLRDHSLQEPADLRIRRRKTPLPEESIIVAFDKKGRYELSKLASVQRLLSNIGTVEVLNADSKQLTHASKTKFDAVITSPPYATALPYIDTHRLSLVWLGLCQPANIFRMQSELTGSREAYNGEKQRWEESLFKNTETLPAMAHQFCKGLSSRLNDVDGFRRRAVPLLLYRYLSHMRQTFAELKSVMKPNGSVGLVIGHNHTNLGGERIDIDTPELLATLASSVGFTDIERRILETYQRYGIHAKNAVSKEELLIFRHP
jgi:site-specific DNA-methyltransferase (cytosine-N4-specific)